MNFVNCGDSCEALPRPRSSAPKCTPPPPCLGLPLSLYPVRLCSIRESQQNRSKRSDAPLATRTVEGTDRMSLSRRKGVFRPVRSARDLKIPPCTISTSKKTGRKSCCLLRFLLPSILNEAGHQPPSWKDIRLGVSRTSMEHIPLAVRRGRDEAGEREGTAVGNSRK